MNASEIMRKEARKVGLCDEHFNAWNPDWTKSELIDYYIENIHWCMDAMFPSYDMAKELFDCNEARERGVHIDASVTTKTTLSTYVLMHCMAGIIVNRVCHIHIRNGSKAKLIVDSGGILMVDIYDDCEVNIETRGTGRAFVHPHGSVKPVTIGNNIKIRKK